MRGRARIVTTLVSAMILGALIALPLGGRRQISVEIWFSAVAVWLALSIVLSILDEAPVLPARLRAIWDWRRSEDDRTKRLPRGLVALEGTVIGARDSDRAYALRLRPRLKGVTDHYLGTHHGIDPDRNPVAAAEVLGDAAWLVDTSVNDRTPTLSEIEHLLDVVLAAPSARTAIRPDNPARSGPEDEDGQ